MALVAHELKDKKNERLLMERAKNYRNVYDPSTGFMRGRIADGSFIKDFDPYYPYYAYQYREANAWNSLFYAPHDPEGIVGLYPSKVAVEQKLRLLKDPGCIGRFFGAPERGLGRLRSDDGVVREPVCRLDEDQTVDISGHQISGADPGGLSAGFRRCAVTAAVRRTGAFRGGGGDFLRRRQRRELRLRGRGDGGLFRVSGSGERKTRAQYRGEQRCRYRQRHAYVRREAAGFVVMLNHYPENLLEEDMLSGPGHGRGK